MDTISYNRVTPSMINLSHTRANRNITYWAPELLSTSCNSVCSTERYGEIVDNLKPNERIVLLHQLTATKRHQNEMTRSPMPQLQALRASSREDVEEDISPDWWFHHFEPVWKPFLQWLRSQKNVTLLEFERAASQVSGLTHIEKTIAISAFRQQQEQGSVPFHNAHAFRRDHSLSAV
jgi:hypothetical protein